MPKNCRVRVLRFQQQVLGIRVLGLGFRDTVGTKKVLVPGGLFREVLQDTYIHIYIYIYKRMYMNICIYIHAGLGMHVGKQI